MQRRCRRRRAQGAPVVAPLEELGAKLTEASPALRAAREELLRAGDELRLARRDYFPDFALMGAYTNKGRLLPEWELGARVTVPLYYWHKPRSRPSPAESPGLDRRERRLLVDSARRRLELFDVEPSHIEELERTRDPKRRIVLHSPIAGYVTLKSVLQGMYVTREMELYTVSDLDRLWIWADVNEDEIPLVELRQRARIEVASAPGERAATVSFLQPTLDPATRTLRVRFDAENPEGLLKPGMYATVILERPLGEVLALPEEAVIDTGARRIVFVEISEGRFQPREVELGRKGQGHYEVLRGLAAGEHVVVSAQFLLDSESRLRGVVRPGHGAH